MDYRLFEPHKSNANACFHKANSIGKIAIVIEVRSLYNGKVQTVESLIDGELEIFT